MKKYYIVTLCICVSIFFVSCNNIKKKITQKELFQHQSATQVNSYVQNVLKQKKQAVENFVNSLSLEDQISQLFIENLVGNTQFVPVEKLSDFSTSVLDDSFVVPGGFLFFSYNLGETAEQTIDFISSIHKYCKQNNKIPPFLAIDQEGGLVNRLKNLCGPLPSAQRVSENLSLEQTYELYKLQSLQMKLLGFDMNLAPVMEICTDDNKVFLNGRSFGDLNQVCNYGKTCVNAYQQNGIDTVIKHFPGNTNTDPHSGLPEIQATKQELELLIQPFIHVLKEKPAGILMSHARTKAIDSQVPSCLSSIWVTEILRQKYNFQGIIFSDDIFMGALAKNGYPPEIAVTMAIEAGIDCIMLSEKRIAQPAKILLKKATESEDFSKKIKLAVSRIIDYKLKTELLQIVEVSPNEYKIQACDFSKENRIQEFEQIKKQNIDFYKKYF
ncbi:MAG: glycoside hydrolase family 3 protein [Treponema sp.]|nr:glycoside hydrolase family 3 protein [Treponema sp.]